MAPGYQPCMGGQKKQANRYQDWLVCSKADTRPTVLITLKRERVETIKPPQRVQSSDLLFV